MRFRGAVIVGTVLTLSAGPRARAEATRTLEGTLPVSPGAAFALENLAGAMKVVPAPTAGAMRVTATVHAESDDLAGTLSFVTVPGKDGIPTLRLQYPVDRHDEFQYPPRGSGRDSGIDYAGRRVRISGTHGVLLYADLLVEVPTGAGAGRLDTRAGAIDAERLDGDLRLDTGSGAIQLVHSKGNLVADTGSGDVDGRDVHGSFHCDTGSGQCRVEGFEGERLSCDTGSGPVVVARAQARTVKVDTGSGQVRLTGIEAEEISVDTGSGGVEIEAVSDRLRKVVADTGSGTVRLRLPARAGFNAKASLGSGELQCDYEDAEKVVRKHEVVGCKRGDGLVQIKVDTGSGGLVIEPSR